MKKTSIFSATSEVNTHKSSIHLAQKGKQVNKFNSPSKTSSIRHKLQFTKKKIFFEHSKVLRKNK